jgi:hypothetical protein
MAVSEVTTQRSSAGGADQSPTITFPAAPTVGNVLVVGVGVRNADTGLTPPTGWTVIAAGAVVDSTTGTGGPTILFYYRVVQSGDGTTYTWAVDSLKWEILGIELTGVDTTLSPVGRNLAHNPPFSDPPESQIAGVVGTAATVTCSSTVPNGQDAGAVTLFAGAHSETWSATTDPVSVSGNGGGGSGATQAGAALTFGAFTGTGAAETRDATLGTAADWGASIVVFYAGAAAAAEFLPYRSSLVQVVPQ